MALFFADRAKNVKRTFAAYALRCSYACNFALDANNLRLIMQINPPSFTCYHGSDGRPARHWRGRKPLFGGCPGIGAGFFVGENLMNNNITHRQVMDRAGNRIEPPPMATYCEPSKRAIARAKGAALSQRETRERAEALALLTAHGFEPQPPAPEMPATLPVWQQPEPDPLLTHDFILGLLTGAMLASATVALLLGARP